MSNTAEIINFRARKEPEEQRVAQLEDGYLRLANELLDATMCSGLPETELCILMAVWRKTYGYSKKMDWVSNEQFEEMIDKHSTHCSTAKNNLIRRKVLLQEGRKVGMNKNISEWKTKNNGFGKTLAKPAKKSLATSAKAPLQKVLTTKDNTQKTINTDPPKAPKGEFSEEVISQAKQVLAYYNELTGTTCRSAEAFAVLLTPRSARSAYTVDDLKLVVRWVVLTWKRRNGTVAKPANICRVGRFDGYLADASAWLASYVEIDCGSVLQAYNEVLGDALPQAELDADREIAIRELLTHLNKKTVDAFRAYFQAFRAEARPYYFGESPSGWKAGFDYLMKPETLRNLREGSL